MSRFRRLLALSAVVSAAAVSLLLIAGGAQAVIKGSPHDFSTTKPISYNHDSAMLAPSGACSACHIPHGAVDSYVLWPRDLSSYRSNLENDGQPTSIPDYTLTPTIQCYDCHDYHGGGGINNDPRDSYFDSNHQPQDIAFGFTKIQEGNMEEDAPVGSVSGFYENKPPHTSNYGADPTLNPSDNVQLLKTGGHYFKHTDPTNSSNDTFDIGDKLPCRDCHDPHAWSSTPTWQAFIRTNWPTSAVSSRLGSSIQASMRMANSPVSGVRSDADSRDICIACHGNSDSLNSVNFTDISSRYSTAAGQIVRPPASVTEHDSSSSVACTSCHLHNSIDAACNDCHSFPGLDNTNSGHQLSSTHWKHVGQPSPEGTANSRKFDCTVCHFNYSSSHNGSGYSAGQPWATDNSWRNNVDINFDSSWNPGSPTYKGISIPTTGGDPPICAGLYCHGNAGVFAGSRKTGANTTPGWDNAASGACGACHGTATQMNSANHPVHLDNTTNPFGPGIDNASCGAGAACHTAYGLSPTATHVDNTISFRTTAANNTAVSLSTTGICENCHSTATAAFEDGSGSGEGNTLVKTIGNWLDNTYKLPCLTCHNNTSQGNSEIDGTGTAAPNIEAQWLVTGHGATVIDNTGPTGTTTVDTSVDPPIYQNVPVPCRMCHDINSRHYGTTLATGNAWRLRASTGYDDANGGLDKFCNTQCHGDAPGSYAQNKPTLPQDHTWILSASPPETKETGQDTHPTGTNVDTGITDPPQATDTMPMDNDVRQGGTQVFLCVTCHDPHGIGASASAPRTFTGTNTTASADNVHMLRYMHDTGSVLCKKCHI